MPAAQQAEYAQQIDPIAYTYAAAQPSPRSFTDYATAARSRLPVARYGNQFDRAIALLAVHNIRRQNPNIGAGQTSDYSDPATGGTKKRIDRMPSGYPADWYTTPAGEELIGLTDSLSPPSWG